MLLTTGSGDGDLEIGAGSIEAGGGRGCGRLRVDSLFQNAIIRPMVVLPSGAWVCSMPLEGSIVEGCGSFADGETG